MARKRGDTRPAIEELSSEEMRQRYPQVTFRMSAELNAFLEHLILTDPLVGTETSVNLLAREALIYWILDKKRLRLKEFPRAIPEIDDKNR